MEGIVMLKGIDVSKWQGTIDWQAVKASGIDFAIIRAGLGNNPKQKDTCFERNYAGAKAAGVPIGAYWYSYASGVQDAIKEAEACLQVIQGKQFEYPIYYDLEDKSCATLGRIINTQMAKQFLNRLEQAGYYAGFYSYTSYMMSYINMAEIEGRYTIWLADYRTAYNMTIQRDIHQYSSSGSVTGIAGRVDMNNCTKEDFPAIIKAAGLNGFDKESAAAPAEKPKLYDIAVLGVTRGDADTICRLCDELGVQHTKVEE